MSLRRPISRQRTWPPQHPRSPFGFATLTPSFNAQIDKIGQEEARDHGLLNEGIIDFFDKKTKNAGRILFFHKLFNQVTCHSMKSQIINSIRKFTYVNRKLLGSDVSFRENPPDNISNGKTLKSGKINAYL